MKYKALSFFSKTIYYTCIKTVIKNITVIKTNKILTYKTETDPPAVSYNVSSASPGVYLIHREYPVCIVHSIKG